MKIWKVLASGAEPITKEVNDCTVRFLKIIEIKWEIFKCKSDFLMSVVDIFIPA